MGRVLFSILLLLGLGGLQGCRRQEPATSGVLTSEPAPRAAVPAGQAGESVAATPAVEKKFSIPFRGVIQLKGQHELLLGTTETRYTIGDRKIRREFTKTAPLGKLAELIQEKRGIICDLQAESVLLYRSELGKKHFVRMTLSEYRERLATKRPGCLDYVGT